LPTPCGMPRQRKPPAKPRYRGVLFAVVVGSVAGIAAGSLSFPWWAMIPVFAAVGLIVGRSMIAAAMTAPTGEVACPRCGQATRTASGWCGSCTGVLVASPVEPSHPINRYLVAAVAGDAAGAADCVADWHTTRMATSTTVKVPRALWRWNVRLNIWAQGERVAKVLALHRDPTEPDVVWVHTHDLSSGRAGMPSIDAELTSKYRLAGDLITETTIYPALVSG
jgi:hypothetical protein